MKQFLIRGAVIATALVGVSPAFAEQREFPTGDRGVSVTYLAEAGPDHPTACVIDITAGLPALAISMNLFSTNRFTMMVASQQPLPRIAADGVATVKINSVYIFSKVTSATKSSVFNVVNLAPVENTSMQTVFDAVNQLVYTITRVDVVADDAQLPSISLPPAPGLGDALVACQKYMIAH